MTRARSEGPFAIDFSTFPVVRLQSPQANEYEHVDVQSFFACTDVAMARHEHFALLHDARGMPFVDEARQAHFLEELKRRRPLISKYMVAYGAVASSPLERGLITALGWFAHLPLPTRLFATEPEARAFLLARCAAGPRVQRKRQRALASAS